MKVHEHFDALDTGRALPDHRTPVREENELPLAFFFAFIAVLMVVIGLAMAGATHSF